MCIFSRLAFEKRKIGFDITHRFEVVSRVWDGKTEKIYIRIYVIYVYLYTCNYNRTREMCRRYSRTYYNYEVSHKILSYRIFFYIFSFSGAYVGKIVSRISKRKAKPGKTIVALSLFLKAILRAYEILFNNSTQSCTS